MTKRELLKKLDATLAEKKMHKIDFGSGAVGEKDNKDTIQAAIDCLNCPDELLDEYMIVFKLKYPNIYTTIKSVSGDNWKTNSFHRAYIYSSAKMILTA